MTRGRAGGRLERRLVVVGALSAALASTCDEPCCTFDSRPIPLGRAATGELLISLQGEAEPLAALLDTGSPVTLWRSPEDNRPARIVRRDITLLGTPVAGNPTPARAVLRRLLTVETPLGTIGGEAEPLAPGAVLGADVLTGFSVELAFAVPQLTLWRRQSASDSFLATVGYAVLHLPRRGGGQLLALDPKDRLGRRAEHSFPPSRLLIRACAAPSAFAATDPLPVRCCPGTERTLSSGSDLSLLLATGVGPVVLGRAAWERVRASLPAGSEPVLEQRPLRIALSAAPVPAWFTRLPRLALVNREADLATDPGPCGELARARRLEQVARLQSENPARAACALPCDRDPRDLGRAQNSAAYLELAGELEVAVIDDSTPFLQAIRLEVRPQGPEVDGLLGAAALASTRVELDYVSQETRAIFSCEPSAPDAIASGSCRSVSRCPRLPGPGQRRACFGLPAHALPEMCEDAATCEE